MPAPPAPALSAPRPDLSSEYETANPEEAHAFMSAAYVDHTVHITGSTENFRMWHSHLDAGSTTIGTLGYTMAVEIEAQPLRKALFCRVVDGRMERTTAGVTQRFEQYDLFPVAAPHVPHIVRWDAVTMQIIGIDDAVLRGLAVDAAQAVPVKPSLKPANRTAIRFCHDLVDYLTRDVMTDREAMANPLIAGSAARMLAVALLTTFPATGWTSADTVTDRVDATPATLRRAMEYLREHAAEDIAPSDVAAAARVSYRSVQLAFRRHLGTSPMRYLRQVRLEQARSDLLGSPTADAATVKAVAFRWGFRSVGRFVEHYRRAYQAVPGEKR